MLTMPSCLLLLAATASHALQHVDEEQLLYTFCRPAGGALECAFQEGEMLLLSVEGAAGSDLKLAPFALPAVQCPCCAPSDASHAKQLHPSKLSSQPALAVFLLSVQASTWPWLAASSTPAQPPT